MQENFYYNSPIGTLKITTENNVITNLSREVNHKKTQKITNFITEELDKYFNRTSHCFNLKIKPKGTPFQQKVWAELQKIPYGETKSYSEIAENIGCQNGQRAVGLACNKNPILLIIPCHRVLAKNGNLTGFACGINIKKQLLELEKQYI